MLTDDNDSFLDYANARGLGLYVHIPFCRSLCSFCPYCKTVFDPDAARLYEDALLKEIDMVGSMHSGRKQATSLYFGGGSPALMVDSIGRITGLLRQHFSITDGIGLELHPQDVSLPTLKALKQAGVTKVSIGIQSFQDGYLALLGRRPVDYQAMFEVLGEVSFDTVSVDLIFALHGQAIEGLAADIDYAFANGANHVAAYPFIDFTFTGRAFPRMRERDKRELLYQLVGHCESKAYVRDSIWTFSKDGAARYSSMTRENFLGFGCSATTLLSDSFKINTFDVESYIKRTTSAILPTALTLHFTQRQRMVYYLFWTLYSMRLQGDAFEGFFGEGLLDCYGAELRLAERLGLVCREPGGFRMTTKGSYYYHYFESYYTLSYIDQMWNLMRREAFPKRLVIS